MVPLYLSEIPILYIFPGFVIIGLVELQGLVGQARGSAPLVTAACKDVVLEVLLWR